MSEEHKKKWFGEHGYCNCLVTTMCRVPIPTLTIRSDGPVPNLEALAASKPETTSWLRAQEFAYESLNSSEVIRILSEYAKFSRWPWFAKVAELETHVVGLDGKAAVHRVKFELQKKRGVSTIRLTQTRA